MAADDKNCLECERPLYGRSDKKFCSDGCRNVFNNRISIRNEEVVKKLNQQLIRNKRVLDEINKDHANAVRVHRDKMLRLGFDFGFHTHVFTLQNGLTYTFCYNQGYRLIDDSTYEITYFPVDFSL